MDEVQEKIWLYRITHIENLSHILIHGLVTVHSENRNQEFIRIGDNSLIEYREELVIPVEPGGLFSEYIPFYFGHRSPMLFQIASGYDGVEKLNQDVILYLVTRLDIIEKSALRYVYTDGHARATITRFFMDSDKSGLQEIDWKLVYSKS